MNKSYALVSVRDGEVQVLLQGETLEKELDGHRVTVKPGSALIFRSVTVEVLHDHNLSNLNQLQLREHSAH